MTMARRRGSPEEEEEEEKGLTETLDRERFGEEGKRLVVERRSAARSEGEEDEKEKMRR